MKGKRTQKILFIFWTILAILTVFWIIINMFNINSLLTESVYQFVFILSCLCLSVSILSIREILADVKLEIVEENEKQRNIQDVYRYQQLLDPPDAEMYN